MSDDPDLSGEEPVVDEVMEEVVEESATPEAPPETPAEAPSEEAREPEFTVPLRVHTDLRETLAAEKAKAEVASQQLADLQARLAALENPQPKEEVPDFWDNPSEHLNARERALTAQQQSVEERLAAFEKAQQEASENAQLANAIGSAEAAFSAQNSDYYDAVQFAQQARAAQIKAVQPWKTDQQVAQDVMEEGHSIARQALENNQNPAEIFYNYARQVGFSQTPAPQEKLVQQATAQKRATSLGSASGGGPSGVSYSALLKNPNMLDEIGLEGLDELISH